ncbi:ATP-binding protein [Actinomyces faecalis]|uniref:ATP-binding protein n=1 Tax=Actinomyces faecalis TaxID=2722820 RepID=UPI001F363B44|nr:ATP-binding protein [Actinomyces faecalis]
MTTTVTPRRASMRLPLRRPLRASRPAVVPGAEGRDLSRQTPRRVVGGVCAGLSAHLGLPVAGTRLVMMLAACIGGSGLLLYLLLWAFVPAGDPWAEATGQVPPTRARLASRLQTTSDGTSRLSANATTLLGGGALVLAALLVTVWRAGYLPAGQWLLPALVVMAGAALSWSQVDAVTGPERDRGAVLRLAGGVVLAAVGILLVLGADTPPRVLLTGALTGGALVICVALVLAPVWLQTTRAMNQARAAEVRQAERADIAAHLHDSVLQTLTLIRKRADEPETVARLARSQERELRAWLYTDRPEAGTSVADAVRDLVGETEDRYGVGIGLVVVGDRAPDRETEVVVAAAREALSNAVRHGAAPVSVYAEITAESLEVFVRDRGPGFDLDDIASDRHGVRESIIARMSRHGGEARIRRLEQGTEVQLTLASPVPASSTTRPTSVSSGS